MIDEGVPGDRDGWPDGVLDALAVWEQGDVVENPPLFYFADPALPVWEATRTYSAGSTGPEVILSPESHLPKFGLVTSQTCDIAEEDRKRPMRPWVQIAPIYAISDKGWQKKLKRGAGPRYWLYIPDLSADETWAADLRIEVPVEKGWLAAQARIDPFPDEEAKAAVGKRLAWLRGRAAFSAEFDSTIQSPFHVALGNLHDNNEDLFDDLMDRMVEVGVLSDSLLHPSTVALVVLTDGELTAESRDWLEEWRDEAYSRSQAVGIDLTALDIRRLDEVSAEEYRRMVLMWWR